MAKYDPTDHHLLSAEARSQGADTLEELAEVSVDLLGLRRTHYSGEHARIATRAVVLQVNHLVELGPEGLALASLTEGKRSRQYADHLLSPVALALVEGLPGAGADAWTPVTSVRGR